jgi:hypothetical protein
MRLYIGRMFTGVTVEPDSRWPDMWRVCVRDRKSDAVNLTRAKDAAITWARPRGLGGGEVIRWDRRESRVGGGLDALRRLPLPLTTPIENADATDLPLGPAGLAGPSGPSGAFMGPTRPLGMTGPPG